jgi:hypothetical protein
MQKLRQMTQSQWFHFEATHAFVRAIAFANLDLQSPRARWETQAHYNGDVKTLLRVSCHFDFPDEIGRALRLSSDGRRSKAIDGPPQLWPLELLQSEDPGEQQLHMQSLLQSIIASNHRAVVTALRGVPVEARSNVATAGEGWKPTRKWPHRLQLDISYIAPLGYESLRYAVMLAGEQKLFHRLARCLTCRRFIFGKTDKPVRYCADDECQPSGSRSRGKAPSVAAEYKRRERERQQRWNDHCGQIRAALRGSTPPRQLALLIRQGMKIADECFRRKTSQARKDAELVLAQAADRLMALKRAARSASRAPGALRR